MGATVPGTNIVMPMPANYKPLAATNNEQKTTTAQATKPSAPQPKKEKPVKEDTSKLTMEQVMARMAQDG